MSSKIISIRWLSLLLITIGPVLALISSFRLYRAQIHWSETFLKDADAETMRLMLDNVILFHRSNIEIHLFSVVSSLGGVLLLIKKHGSPPESK